MGQIVDYRSLSHPETSHNSLRAKAYGRATGILRENHREEFDIIYERMVKKLEKERG